MTRHDVLVDEAYAANLLGALAVGVGDQMLDRLRAASGLDEAAVAGLLVVRERPGQSINELAAALSVTHSGAVRVVNRLTERGLVARGRGRDGRSRGLSLSAAGHAVAERALAVRRETLQRLLGAVPAGERERFVDVVGAVLACLPLTRADAWRICRVCEHGVCRERACPVGSAITERE